MAPTAATALPPLAAEAPGPAPRSEARESLRLPARSVRRVPAARLVAAADIGLVVCSVLAAVGGPMSGDWTRSIGDLFSARIRVFDAALLVGFGLAVYLMFERAHLYDAGRLRRGTDEAARVVVAVTAVVLLAAALLALSHPGVVSVQQMLQSWVGGLVTVGSARAIRSRVARSAATPRRVLIIGSGPHARRICRELSVDPLTRYQVVGFVDRPDTPCSAYVARRTLGSLDDLERILAREHVDEVHVGLPVRSQYPQIQETIRVCERIGVTVMYGADIFGTELARPRIGGAAGAAPCVRLLVVADGWPLIVKRAIDILAATIGLIVLSPLLLAAAAAVRLTSAGPVLYAQERYGLNRRRFRMLKFRTMVQDAERLQAALESRNEVDGPVFKIANDPRITTVGRWLRRTSIDELPQLLNVLRGDMSLVGPRPLPLRDVGRFTRSADMRRFSVLPGITGLWQVSGRSGLSFDQWVTLDLQYIDRWSLGLDLKILARTLPAVIRGTGAV